ncbi:hypothetical protein [Amycolatopsis aidingensis]|uniref:hypothetical protein n=1 Tax=Amycolatopsis aidingensis TaxID=2842453 RepID=UPI001C0B0199|nr:hypothetical protein [Amycolatopsis aidingensis]
MSSRFRAELALALAVPRWAFRFYLRYLPVIGGLSLVPAVQRLVVVNWAEQLPGWLATATEVLVLGVRILLLVVIWRLAMRGVPEHQQRWGTASAFATAHWPSLVLQGVLLSLAFLTFDLLAEHAVAGLLPESARQGYLAVLLMLKNPTVIAFTFVWLVGMVRQVFGSGVPEPAGRGRRVP